MLWAQRQTGDLLWKGDQQPLGIPSSEQVVGTSGAAHTITHLWICENALIPFQFNNGESDCYKMTEIPNGTVVTFDF